MKKLKTGGCLLSILLMGVLMAPINMFCAMRGQSKASMNNAGKALGNGRSGAVSETVPGSGEVKDAPLVADVSVSPKTGFAAEVFGASHSNIAAKEIKKSVFLDAIRAKYVALKQKYGSYIAVGTAGVGVGVGYLAIRKAIDYVNSLSVKDMVDGLFKSDDKKDQSKLKKDEIDIKATEKLIEQGIIKKQQDRKSYAHTQNSWWDHQDKDRQFFDAVRNNNIVEAQKLLDAGASVHAWDWNTSLTPLHYVILLAVELSRKESVPEVVTFLGHEHRSLDYFPMIEFLIQKGACTPDYSFLKKRADFSYYYSYDYTYMGGEGIFKGIIPIFASRSLLGLIAERGVGVEMAKIAQMMIVAHGANINLQSESDVYTCSPLDIASLHMREALLEAQEVLQKVQEYDAADEDQSQEFSHNPFLQQLALDALGKKDKEDEKDLEKVLLAAIDANDIHEVEHCIEQGVDLNAFIKCQYKHKMSCIDNTVYDYTKNDECTPLQYLIEHVDHQDSKNSPVGGWYYQLKSADKTEVSTDPDAPVIDKDYAPMVRLLLEHKADANLFSKDEDKRDKASAKSPLHLAISRGDQMAKIAQLLVVLGEADVHQTNDSGMTLLSRAEHVGSVMKYALKDADTVRRNIDRHMQYGYEIPKQDPFLDELAEEKVRYLQNTQGDDSDEL